MQDIIDNLIPVAFGWILGILTVLIPKSILWFNAKRIQNKYKSLIDQIKSGKLSRTSNIQMPSFIAGKKQSYTALPDQDKKLLFERLQEIVLSDKNWMDFHRIVKYLDKKMHT